MKHELEYDSYVHFLEHVRYIAHSELTEELRLELHLLFLYNSDMDPAIIKTARTYLDDLGIDHYYKWLICKKKIEDKKALAYFTEHRGSEVNRIFIEDEFKECIFINYFDGQVNICTLFHQALEGAVGTISHGDIISGFMYSPKDDLYKDNRGYYDGEICTYIEQGGYKTQCELINGLTDYIRISTQKLGSPEQEVVFQRNHPIYR